MDKAYFSKTFNFSSDSAAPLYAQLASYIKIQIQAGVFKPGDKVIAENELCELLNISRTTVRQCMNQLTEEGYIVRYRRKGSFITVPKYKRSINHLYDFTEDMLSHGAIPTSIIMTSEIEELTNESLLAKLQMPSMQNKVFHLLRLRCANGEPVLLENTYIPYYLCPGIEQYDFSKMSLYHILTERYSLNLYHANESIEAIAIEKKEAELLKCRSKVPGYNITRISHLDSGYVFEYTTSIMRADKCIFQLDLYKNINTNKNPVQFQRHISLDNCTSDD